MLKTQNKATFIKHYYNAELWYNVILNFAI